MPNWIDNEIIIKSKTKEDIKEWLDSGVKETDLPYSFNSWIPMPETYKKYDTTNNSVNSLRKRLGERLGYDKGEIITEELIKEYDKGKIITEELIKEYEEAISYQQRTYGAVGWYDWSCKYWGTKWDSDLNIQCYKNSATITTNTAWSPPLPFLRTISSRFPKFIIDIKSHDEGGGNFHYIFHNGTQSANLSEADGICIKHVINQELRKEGKTDLLKYVKEYIRNDCFYIFDLDDPGAIMSTFMSYVDWKKEYEDE